MAVTAKISIGTRTISTDEVGEDVAIVGPFTLTGNAAIVGNFGLTGNLTVTGNLSATGNATLGDASGDTQTLHGNVYLGGSAGSEGLRVVASGTAANHATINGGGTGAGAQFGVYGSDTNAWVQFFSKGSGAIYCATGGGSVNQFVVTHTASADRYVYATGSNGGNPSLGTSGGALNLAPATSAVNLAGTQILSTRKTGWTAPTGTATRTSFATSTATTEQVAQALKALIDDLTSHGLIGA